MLSLDKDFDTYLQQERIKACYTQAKLLKTDPHRQRRMQEQLCRVCMYVTGKIGGAMTTHKPCDKCEDVIKYSSTYTDKLCIKCAKGADRCKHCNADINV